MDPEDHKFDRTATLTIYEYNQFKNLMHLRLEFHEGDNTILKSYMTTQIDLYKERWEEEQSIRA